MSDFEETDQELKALWGSFLKSEKGKKAKKAIIDMAEVNIPADLVLKIKNQEPERFTTQFFIYRTAVVFTFLFITLFSVYLYRQQDQIEQYSKNISTEMNFDNELLGSFFSEDEDKDIIDETLTTMEEIIWSV